MNSNRIIHLFIKETGENRYFGSISAMYDVISREVVGIARQSLLNYFCANKQVDRYENNRCIIIKSIIERKERKE